MNKFSPHTAVLSVHDPKSVGTPEVAVFFAVTMLIMALLPLKLHADPAENAAGQLAACLE